MSVSAKLTRTPIKAFRLLCCLVSVTAIPPARALVVDIPATTSGYVEYDGQLNTYEKFYGDLQYGQFSHHYTYVFRAFLKFSLDSLPDTCTLTSAELDYYQYASPNPPGLPSVNIRLVADPVPPSAAEVFLQMDSATSLSPYCAFPDGWVQWHFDSTAISLLDSCRKAGWGSFGVHWVQQGPGGWIVAYAYGPGGPDAPHLRIEYTAPGTSEAQGNVARQPELTISPNPSTGRLVMARYDIAAGTRCTLTLHDVLGRVVKSFALDPSGIARLDLRGLAPGVYMATLDAGDQSLTRKLVLTAR